MSGYMALIARELPESFMTMFALVRSSVCVEGHVFFQGIVARDFLATHFT